MDSHQIFGYNITGAGLSCTSSHPSIPSIPSRFFGALKAKIGDSPDSPFFTHFVCDTNNGQGQRRSTENLSGAHPCTSSADTSSYFHQLRPSVDCQQDNPLHRSAGTSYLQDANSSQNIKNTLYRLESALMGPDVDEEEEATTSNTSLHCFSPGSDLKQMLIACARALAENNIKEFDKLVEKARCDVSITGDPIQRLGAYMVEGLVARKEVSGSNIYRALKCSEPESKDLLSYMQILYEICPYLKFGYMAANGAIADVCRNKDRIHIIDFQIAQGTQWTTLLQALAARPSGAPHVRITGIDDHVNRYARGDGLEAVGKRLAAISEKFNIPLVFHGVPVFAQEVTIDMLNIRPGETLAVNFPLQLHHTPDESVDLNNPRDGLLRMVKSLSPDVVTLVEQESNTNTTPFLTRFIETLDYYLAIFESIDVTIPRDRKERVQVEQHCLARDIVNIIACEGKERVERHELFGKWKSRLSMAGFKQYPLSTYVNSVIRNLLRYYSDHYTLVEKDGAMLLAWKGRNLISASAWQ